MFRVAALPCHLSSHAAASPGGDADLSPELSNPPYRGIVVPRFRGVADADTPSRRGAPQLCCDAPLDCVTARRLADRRCG